MAAYSAGFFERVSSDGTSVPAIAYFSEQIFSATGEIITDETGEPVTITLVNTLEA